MAPNAQSLNVLVEDIFPGYIVYPLSTPQETQITPVQITLLNGNNTVWADSDGDIEIAYQESMIRLMRQNFEKGVY